MIAAFNLIQNLTRLELRLEAVGNADVINPPTSIDGARTCAVVPPRVNVLTVRIKVSKGIGESEIEKASEPLALFRQKAGHFAEANRVMNIDVQIGDVIVAHQNHLALLEDAPEMVIQIGQKLLLEIVPLFPAAAVREIDVVEQEVAVIRDDHPTFVVVGLDSHAHSPFKGWLRRECRDTGVTLLHGTRPNALQSTGCGDLRRNLIGMSLRLLQAEGVRPLALDKGQKAFFSDRTNAVHIPGDDFHGVSY